MCARGHRDDARGDAPRVALTQSNTACAAQSTTLTFVVAHARNVVSSGNSD